MPSNFNATALTVSVGLMFSTAMCGLVSKKRKVSASPFWIVSPATPLVDCVAETQSGLLLVISETPAL